MYKIVTPSIKNRLLTTWKDGDPVEQFEAVEMMRFPLSTRDVDIDNSVREITKQRVEKLLKEKEAKLHPEQVEEQPEEKQNPEE